MNNIRTTPPPMGVPIILMHWTSSEAGLVRVEIEATLAGDPDPKYTHWRLA